jgi:hypothetical protein
MNSGKFESSRFENRLYVEGGVKPKSVVLFGIEDGLPVVCEPYLAEELHLKPGSYIPGNCKPYTLENPKGFFRMHRSNGYGLSEFIYFSSDDPNFIRRAIDLTATSKGGPVNRAYRWVLRKKDIIKHHEGQKIIDLTTAQKLSPNITLSKEYEGMKWSEEEIIPTEDKLHRNVLRTFKRPTFQDFDVSSFSTRNKSYRIFGDNLIQMLYRTLSGYSFEVLGEPDEQFPHGEVFMVTLEQLENLIKKDVPYKILQPFSPKNCKIGVTHEDESKVEDLLDVQSSSDFIRLKNSIVSISDSERQPLPFIVDDEPEEVHSHKKI